MLNENLIIVCGPVRSGTSLTMGLLESQGVWVGDCTGGNVFNLKGNFDNIEIGQIVSKRAHEKISSDVMINKTLKVLFRQKYIPNTPWAIKQKAGFLEFWKRLSPLIIITKRDVECIAESRIRSLQLRKDQGGISKNISLSFKKAKKDAIGWYEGIEEDVKDYKYYYLDTNNIVVNNDYSEFVVILKKIGLVLDITSAESFVEPKYWHYKK